ncbi:MAG: aminoacyl-tRNA hydrolase [Clostridia bacterium]
MDYIIVGLGNPGKKYENTRHNAGFIVIDKLAKKLGVNINKLKFKSLVSEAKIGDKKVLLLKPDTFMNLSGEALVQAMTFYKIKPENVIVILDDISLDVGKMRIRRKGSDGGQNGMKNIIYLSGSDNFPRIKVGIGKKPHPDYNLADWVLSQFTQNDGKLIDEIAEKSCDAVVHIVNGNTDKAMNLYNC